MFASSVVCSDRFEGLAPQVQLLYIKLNFEASSIGEIRRVRKYAQLYDCGPDDVDALIEAGFLIVVNERCFIRHYFVHNHTVNKKQASAAQEAYESVEGLAFEGPLLKSAYATVSLDVVDESMSDRQSLGSKENGIEVEVTTSNEASTSIPIESGNAQGPVCPRCHSAENVKETESGQLTCSCGYGHMWTPKANLRSES